MKKDNIDDLLILREETRKTGFLTELQVKHLKLWPLIISDKITKSEAKFIYEKNEVDFSLTMTGKITKDFSKRFAALTQWVQTLLGEEYAVKIKVGGKQVFKGDRLKAAPDKKNREGDKYLDELNKDFEKDKYAMGNVNVKVVK